MYKAPTRDSLLSGFIQMTVITGLWLANVMNIIVENLERGWRTTNGVAMAAPLVVMLGIWFVPESPRWTYQKKGKKAAEAVLKHLRQTDDVDRELQVIGYQVLEKSRQTRVLLSYLNLPSSRFFRFCSKQTWINPIMSYGALIFKDITNTGIYSAFFLSSVNMLSTIPAMRWVDMYGRCLLLLIGAVIMITGHLVAAVLFTATCNGNVDNAGCSMDGGWLIYIGSAFFVFKFAISWGPIAGSTRPRSSRSVFERTVWLYPLPPTGPWVPS